MSRRGKESVVLPWLPPGEVVQVADRGEFFVRIHRHPDPTAPMLLLLHGWSGSGDLHFFPAYETLAERYGFVAIDHRGHGRGVRPLGPFTLEDCADDAAAVLRTLALPSVVAVGYSMGGPVAMLLRHRHPSLVSGLVLLATAGGWHGERGERARLRVVRAMWPLVRLLATHRAMRRVIRRLVPRRSPVAVHREWIAAEMMRGDLNAIRESGRALSAFDAHDWAETETVSRLVVVTADDRLVPPARQRELAASLQCEAMEVDGDHLVAWNDPDRFATALRIAVDTVVSRC